MHHYINGAKGSGTVFRLYRLHRHCPGRLYPSREVATRQLRHRRHHRPRLVFWQTQPSVECLLDLLRGRTRSHRVSPLPELLAPAAQIQRSRATAATAAIDLELTPDGRATLFSEIPKMVEH